MEVRVVRSARRRRTVQASLVDGVMVVHIPTWMSAREEAEVVEEMRHRLSARPSRRSDADLAERAATLAARYLLPPPTSVRWSSRQSQRWGSCTLETGDVRISDRLAEAPGWVLDYVLVHELAHLLAPNHDERFAQLVSRYERSERAEGYLDGMGLRGDDVEAADGAGVVGLDHVQLAMPPGPLSEVAAEEFYAGKLGIPRAPKPPLLAARGGCWFENDSVRVHLGVQDDFRPANKAHPALAVKNLAGFVARLAEAGVEVLAGDGVAGVSQAYIHDPFGNRIELIERG